MFHNRIISLTLYSFVGETFSCAKISFFLQVIFVSAAISPHKRRQMWENSAYAGIFVCIYTRRARLRLAGAALARTHALDDAADGRALFSADLSLRDAAGLSALVRRQHYYLLVVFQPFLASSSEGAGQSIHRCFYCKFV